MSGRSQAAAIAAAIAFLGAVAVLMAAAGSGGRSFLPRPYIAVVGAPEDSFALWQQQALRGRILVLVDRSLGADPVELTYEFQSEEFAHAAALERFCAALASDLRQMAQPLFSCTVQGLNDEVLQQRNLYPLFLAKAAADPSGEITRLAGYLNLPDGFDAPPPEGGRAARAGLNRLILQQLYPSLCPQLPRFYVTARNYVHQAVMAGTIRKIYHLVPADEWDTAARVLRSLPGARPFGGGYRITIAEGVPVMVLRVGDMPRTGEPALVNVNTDSVAPEELRQLPRLIADDVESDLVTVSGGQAAALIDLLGRL
jgi:hypothetical protein